MPVATRRRGVVTAVATALVAGSLALIAPVAEAAPVGATVTTQASPTITLGAGTISDSATVTTTTGSPPTGTVTFDVFPPADTTCSGTPVFTSTNPLTDGDAASDEYTPTEGGTFRFTAHYSGDVNNPTGNAFCDDANESTTVDPAPSSVTTQESGSVQIGGSISDSATVGTTSGWPPTGTVTFNLYGPNDTECSEATAFTSTVSVTDGDADSGSFTPTSPGTYRWIATYDGDANNASISGYCGDPTETTDVTRPPTGVVTNASAPITLGAGSITDSATVNVTSGVPPTGTVTFDVYGPDDTGCSGDPVSTSTTWITDGDAQSDPFTPLVAGVYRFFAYYNGDASNAPGVGDCTDPSESVTVSGAPVTMTTQASGSIVFGSGSISDVATVTPTTGPDPEGTVTFDVFGPDNVSCTGTPAFTSTNPVSGGTATSDSFTPTAVGRYRFVAHYSGDGHNAAADGACNDPNESTMVDSLPSNNGPPPTTAPSTSPSASTSPTATPSASPTAGGGRQPLTLTVTTPNINAGGVAVLVGTGSANEAYQLLCYTRPSTTYFTARQGTFDSLGNPVMFRLSLGRNTRCFLQYATNSASGASPSRVVNVRTVLSLSAIRVGTRAYVFQGRNLPRAAGQLITLYRLDTEGNEIRTANLVTDSSGIYRLTRTFTGTGTFGFLVRTGQTLNNAAGVSRTIVVNIH